MMHTKLSCVILKKHTFRSNSYFCFTIWNLCRKQTESHVEKSQIHGELQAETHDFQKIVVMKTSCVRLYEVKWQSSVMSDSLQPYGLYSPWNSPSQDTGVGCHALLQGNLPNPGIKPWSPTLQVVSSPAEPQRKPKNTGVGSLSLLLQIFPPRNWTGSKVKVAQSCLTLCNPMDHRIHGILQARILEWVAFPFCGGSSQPRDGNQITLIASGYFTSWAKRQSDSMNRTKAMLRR